MGLFEDLTVFAHSEEWEKEYKKQIVNFSYF